MEHIARNDALALLKKYNKDPFHIQHALTVEAVMKWYANELGYGEDAEYWGIVGLLHDIDFELYPAEHCLKAPELLKDGGVSDDIIHASRNGKGLICCRRINRSYLGSRTDASVQKHERYGIKIPKEEI